MRSLAGHRQVVQNDDWLLQRKNRKLARRQVLGPIAVGDRTPAGLPSTGMTINNELTAEQESGVADRIATVVASWPDVEAAPHRFGGVEFRLGRRELGHLHGDRIADLPFPRLVRDQLIAAGKARPHHVLPDSGWVTVSLDRPRSADRAIELFHLSYERATRAANKRARSRSDL